MTRAASGIAAAELKVVQSRLGLRQGWRRLRSRLSQPPFLAAAATVAVLLGFYLTRRGRMGAVAGPLATALIRHGVQHLIIRRQQGCPGGNAHRTAGGSIPS
jgi:hypothetical protein